MWKHKYGIRSEMLSKRDNLANTEYSKLIIYFISLVKMLILYQPIPVMAKYIFGIAAGNSLRIICNYGYKKILDCTVCNLPMYLFINVIAVLAFNSFTSRPDVCQYLAVQTLMDNMSKNKPSTTMAHVPCKPILRQL